MPETAQAAAKTAPESVIEVDLDQADPTKAVTRQTRGGVNTDTDTRTEGTKSADEWAERSKEVRRRIRGVARNFEQKIADMEAAHQRERAEMRAEMEKLRLERRQEAQPGAPSEAEHERKMGDLQAKLAEAQEKGDSTAIARLTVEITRTENAYWAAKTAAQLQTKTAESAAATTTAAAATSAPAKPAGPTAAGGRFISANEDWWDDPEFAAEKLHANQTYTRLVKEEGFEPNSDELYDAIADELNRKFRDLNAQKGTRSSRRRAEDSATTAREGATTARAAVTAVQDRGEVGARTRARVTLTPADIATMRSVQMDPNNDKHVLQYLRESQAYEAQA